jgi:ATP-dependent exoDNAse (exonuclease V) beta subunit
MLYVAFTRAEEAIYGYSNFSLTKGVPPLTSTGNVLYTLFSKGFHFSTTEASPWDPVGLSFDWGDWPAATQEEPEAEPVAPEVLRWAFLDWKSKLDTKTYAWDFSPEGIRAREQRDLGVIIHDLLAESESLDDALRLLRQFTFEGRWDEPTAAEIKGKLEQLFALPQVQSWFDSGYQALTEQGILLPGGGQRRPDRILLSEKEVLVIDFKTGVKRESHLSQVKEYMGLVATLTQLPVKGYLCYLEPTEIVAL